MLRYLSKTPIRNKRVLVRVDFNVPIARGKVLDDYDIIRALPTLRRLLRGGNVLVILSHHSNRRRSLAPLTPLLRRKLRRSVVFLRDPFRARVLSEISRASPGSIFLVENLRFWPGEQSNRHSFAAALATLGEVYVNDAFGELHRPYASIVGIPRFLPSYAGPLVARELRMLERFRHRTPRPLVGVFGGAKVSTKLPILRRLARWADRVLVGGAIANTLLAERGLPVGRSPVERDVAGAAKLLASPRILLPVDAVVARRGRPTMVTIGNIKGGDVISDIGPKTQRFFRGIVRRARTVIWNGPLGLVERSPYCSGTLAIARTLAAKSSRVVVGGGDTIAFLSRMELLPKFRYVSTGGGAMLAYLAEEELPGLEALRHSRR